MLLWVIWVLQLVKRIVPVKEYPSNPSGAKERPQFNYAAGLRQTMQLIKKILKQNFNRNRN